LRHGVDEGAVVDAVEPAATVSVELAVVTRMSSNTIAGDESAVVVLLAVSVLVLSVVEVVESVVVVVEVAVVPVEGSAPDETITIRVLVAVPKLLVAT